MRKLGSNAAGLVAIVSLIGCGSSDPLVNTTWQSMTVTTEAMTDGVTSMTYLMTFHSDMTFTATLTRVYGSTGTHAGCTLMSTIAGGTWSEDLSNASDETFTVTGTTAMTTASGCTDATQNHAAAPDDTGLAAYLNGGPATHFTISGTTMVAHGASGLPYEPTDTMTFIRV